MDVQKEERNEGRGWVEEKRVEGMGGGGESGGGEESGGGDGEGKEERVKGEEILWCRQDVCTDHVDIFIVCVCQLC